jgi:CheY-like chemotaxis protein
MIMASSTSPKQVTTGSILIVEDERVSRRALAMLLASCGYLTASAASGEEALRMMRGRSAPSIAVVDLDLPGMNGLDLIARLKALNPKLHSVLITGADCERLDSLMKNRPVPCLRKPVDFEQLLNLLNPTEMQN